jgi:hypothetical protein
MYCSYLKSVLRYKFLIWIPTIWTLYLLQQGCESWWLSFEAKRVRLAQKFREHGGRTYRNLTFNSRVIPSLLCNHSARLKTPNNFNHCITPRTTVMVFWLLSAQYRRTTNSKDIINESTNLRCSHKLFLCIYNTLST